MVGSRETGNETYVLGIIDGLVSLDVGSELYVYHAGNSGEQAGPRVHSRQLLGSGAWCRLTLDLPIRSWTDHLDVIHTTYVAPLCGRCPAVLTVHHIFYPAHPEGVSTRDLPRLS